ncbi:GNAT family N-acetyltransferase [Agrobacterium rubi]|nr:GNAT family N-acetyltransferase [Agrobacterium rubi]NTF24329.1 GNAT family N-acetyltransferase [Agrobacterium rubi]
MENSQLNVPEDIRAYGLDEFLCGPSDDEDVRDLDIDDIFAKGFDRVLDEARRYHGDAFLEPSGFSFSRQSDIDGTMRYVRFEGGTLIVSADGDAVIGGFIESDLSLDRSFHGRGIGTELVVEHFMDSGSLPTWYLDSPAYSRKGLATCTSAHAYPRTSPDAYFTKAARHVMMNNEEIFRPVAEARGYEEVLAALKAALAQSEPGRFKEEILDWLDRNATDPVMAR